MPAASAGMTPNSPLAETETGCRDASGRNYTYNYDIDYVTYLCYDSRITKPGRSNAPRERRNFSCLIS